MRRIAFVKFLCFAVLMLGSGAAMADENAMHKTLSLTDILASIYKNNPALMAAREELRETEELYPQARAGFLPKINAEAGVFVSDVETTNFGAGDGATTKDLSVYLDQPIWEGGKAFAQSDRAMDLINAGQYVLRSVEAGLFLDGVRAYLSVIRGRRLLQLRIENERIVESELNAASERFNMGELTKTDVSQAKTRLSRAQAERIEAENALHLARAELDRLAGFAHGSTLEIPTPLFDFPDSLEAMVELAEAQNPEIAIARFQQSAAENNVKAEFRELLPQISAYASFNKQYDPQPGIIDSSQTGTLGLRLRVPLYQGGAQRSRVREARHAAHRGEYELRDIRKGVREDIIQNWKIWRAAQAKVKSRALQVEAAEEARVGVKEEARLGERTVLDILDIDQELISAQSAMVEAEYEEIFSQYALAANLGLLSAETLGVSAREQ